LTALSEKTENIHSIPNFTGDFSDTIGILGRCALYRDLPWVLKPGFWFYTDDINNAIMPDSSEDSSTSPYLYDDAAYYEELKEQGLSIDDEEGTNGSFRFIHLIGAHGPYTLDENGQYAGEDGSTLQQQCAGSLKIVDEYLRQLKELGVYDQSTIIVTADHGDWYLAPDIADAISPILLVKPAGTAEENAEPCQISDALTGHMDLSATLVDAMGGDSSSWGTRIQDATDEPRLRYFRSTSVEGENHTYTWIKEWQIDGDALDFDDWSLTGTEWPIIDD
jgi:arylsulfatase A-like enzyme